MDLDGRSVWAHTHVMSLRFIAAATIRAQSEEIEILTRQREELHAERRRWRVSRTSTLFTNPWQRLAGAMAAWPPRLWLDGVQRTS